jgi:hypothetical protein
MKRVSKMGKFILQEAVRNKGVVTVYPPGSPRHGDVEKLVRDGFLTNTLLGLRLTDAGHSKGAPRGRYVPRRWRMADD